MKNNNKFPLVTIVIPVYNGSNYMKEAINSALKQTYKNIEIIVVNDGSNDGGETEKIAKSYGDKIRYFPKENGGVSTALNLALKNMRGEYFSWLSHDDSYYPDKIEKQINYLRENNMLDKKVILYADYDLIDEKGRLITKCNKDHNMLEEKPQYSLLRGSVNGITLLIPKAAFDDYGFFDETLRCTQDYLMWHNMSKTYNLKHMPGIIASSRFHSGQVTNTNPKVISEGNELWTMMVKSLSKKEMISLEGSEYKFYDEMAKFLHGTTYQGTEEYCIQKCLKLKEEIKKNINEHKVSIIIPFFNRISLVEKSLKSALQQTHQNIEVILVNDCSTESIDSIKKIIDTNKKVKLINLKENKGAANARNVGMDAATGEYVAFLDSDDLFMEDKIATQLEEMLLSNSNISHTSYLRKGFEKDIIVHSGELTGNVISRIIYNCSIATPTVMIKLSFLNKYKLRFNSSLTIGEDTCFWMEIVKNSELLGIDKALSIVNVLDSSAAYNNEKQLIGYKTILHYILNDDVYSKYNLEIKWLMMAFIDCIDNTQNHVNNDLLCPNCIKILNSRSWKITKPVRLISTTFNSVKKNGIVFTCRKIKNKLVNKFVR